MLPPELAARSPLAPAAAAQRQAAAAVRARRLLRRVVLGTVFPALVRRAGLRGARADACAATARAAATSRCSSPDSTTMSPTSSTSPSTLPSPPVLIGHSMGAVDRRAAHAHAARSAPPRCSRRFHPAALRPVASRLMAWQPEYLVNMQRLDAPHLAGDVLAALRPMYFSDNVAPADPGRGATPLHARVGARAARPDAAPARRQARRAGARPFVLGVGDDRIATPRDVQRDRVALRRSGDHRSRTRAHDDARARLEARWRSRCSTGWRRSRHSSAGAPLEFGRYRAVRRRPWPW